MSLMGILSEFAVPTCSIRLPAESLLLRPPHILRIGRLLNLRGLVPLDGGTQSRVFGGVRAGVA